MSVEGNRDYVATTENTENTPAIEPKDPAKAITTEFNKATNQILEKRTPAETVNYNFLAYVRNIASQLHHQTTRDLAHHLATLAMANGLYHFDNVINALKTNDQYPALADIINSTIATIDQKTTTEDNTP
ncbi:hypothetical protein KA036_02475, partial [Candidatus Gracilibacteria bacterium]|nr:hypothetical protein [Candidatus Gracilibacteria bacterium]